MKKYLLTITYPPDSPQPPPEQMAESKNVQALHDELQAAGAWVFW